MPFINGRHFIYQVIVKDTIPFSFDYFHENLPWIPRHRYLYWTKTWSNIHNHQQTNKGFFVDDCGYWYSKSYTHREITELFIFHQIIIKYNTTTSNSCTGSIIQNHSISTRCNKWRRGISTWEFLLYVHICKYLLRYSSSLLFLSPYIDRKW